jgi:hypothetical protein
VPCRPRPAAQSPSRPSRSRLILAQFQNGSGAWAGAVSARLAVHERPRWGPDVPAWEDVPGLLDGSRLDDAELAQPLAELVLASAVAVGRLRDCRRLSKPKLEPVPKASHGPRHNARSFVCD